MQEIKRTYRFSKDYIHAKTQSLSTVSCDVEVDYDTRAYFIDHGAAHIAGGSGHDYNLPKMIATAEMHIEVLAFLRDEFSK